MPVCPWKTKQCNTKIPLYRCILHAAYKRSVFQLLSFTHLKLSLQAHFLIPVVFLSHSNSAKAYYDKVGAKIILLMRISSKVMEEW